MQIPQMTLVSSITPVPSVDVTLHELVGVSWHILMPYTVIGVGLMTYSQVRLVRGQRVLSNERRSGIRKSKSPTKA